MFIHNLKDKRKIGALRFFSSLSKENNDDDTLVGRPTNRKINNNEIFTDILNKLQVKKNDKILTIGTGCGKIAGLWIKQAIKLKLNLHILDFPDVILKIKKKYPINLAHKKLIKFISGSFPEIIKKSKNNSIKLMKFSCIELYGVIQYSNNFLKMIDNAVNLLDDNGRLLIGDIPNLSYKGRFLSTDFGVNFESNYKNLKLKKINSVKNYVKHKMQSGEVKINDETLIKILSNYRKKGYNVYLLNQNNKLPFYFTREDILITKNFYELNQSQ
jgi:hypothetical protein